MQKNSEVKGLNYTDMLIVWRVTEKSTKTQFTLTQVINCHHLNWCSLNIFYVPSNKLIWERSQQCQANRPNQLVGGYWKCWCIAPLQLLIIINVANIYVSIRQALAGWQKGKCQQSWDESHWAKPTMPPSDSSNMHNVNRHSVKKRLTSSTAPEMVWQAERQCEQNKAMLNAVAG